MLLKLLKVALRSEELVVREKKREGESFSLRCFSEGAHKYNSVWKEWLCSTQWTYQILYYDSLPLLLPSPLLKKISKNRLPRCSRVAFLTSPFTFTMVEENFQKSPFQML